VLGAQGAERVQVRLDSGVEVALKPTNLMKMRIFAGGGAFVYSKVLGFSLGSTVVIQGVLTKPELNSQKGTVLGAQGAERVQVRLDSGVKVALKPTNLRVSSESGL
jgi:translation initiation factor IF-1